jgi:4-hydroxybenzoate polyprenyltransferase
MALVQPDVRHLPYRKEMLDWLIERRGNRRLVLVTGAHQRFAEAVAGNLGIFDGVMGSTAEIHLTGPRKQAALVERFGANGYDYVGDSGDDLPVWQSARQAYCVASKEQLWGRIQRAKLTVEPLRFDGPRPSRWKLTARLLRLHQWLKNVLVFAPLVTSHRILSVGTAAKAGIMAAAFCCCASAAYILNDFLDLDADRQHSSKRHRPLAAGVISIPAACSAALTLILAAIGLSLLLPVPAAGVLALYFVVTLLYSAWIKRIVLADVFTLAGLYSLRVLGGGAAAGIVVSEWTLAFFMFLFLSLALLKRYTEISKMSPQNDDTVRGRGYLRSDIGFVGQCGLSSGLVSALVFALYIHSPEVHPLYRHPQWLWLLDPILAYGVLRLWLAGSRGTMHDDPIIFAAKDPAMYILGAIGVLLIVLASV